MINRERLKSYLEISANLAVVMVSLILLGSFALNWINARWPTQAVISGITKGQQFPANLNVDYGNSPYTLVLALNTECDHCTKNINFYNEVPQVTNSGKRIRTLALFPNSGEEVRQYCQEHQLTVDYRDSIDLHFFKVAATPTLVLVDQSGHVLDFWIGEIARNDQERILSFLAALQ
jgi:thioredoxin-related protein